MTLHSTNWKASYRGLVNNANEIALIVLLEYFLMSLSIIREALKKSSPDEAIRLIEETAQKVEALRDGSE